MITYGSIVPLIGGESLGIASALNGQHPEWVLSYSDFEQNDAHYLNYLNKKGWKGDYVKLDETPKYKAKKVDVVNTVCPCAGLSSLSPASSGTNPTNNWMYESAEYVLGNIKPKVFWGENAPRLAQSTGIPVVKKLREIGKKHGYVLSIYKTKSKVQGYSQIRDRTFYFFWQGNKAPLFDYIHRPHQRIEDLILSVKNKKGDPMSECYNKNIPSEDTVYGWILEQHGMTHKEFIENLEQSNINLFSILDTMGDTKFEAWDNIIADLEKRDDAGAVRWHRVLKRMADKEKAGGNTMRRTIVLPKDYIGAFVGHLPGCLLHPVEDRFLTYREMLSIMYLPEDFELLNPKKQVNHICQNVPVKTARDMMEQIKLYFNNQLDLIETDYLLQDNKRKVYEYEKKGLQLDEFMV
jgi:site-specific DNA-cytosine methylase